MKALFITSTHNSLSQQLLIKLTERWRGIAVALATSEEAVKTAVAKHHPDLIVVPMLTVPIPEAIWCHHRCLIMRSGKGDRASSLYWAISMCEKSSWRTALPAPAVAAG